MSDAAATIGARIKKARDEKEWTQDQLARKLGVTWVTVSRWERGVNPPPTNRLHLVASVLDTSAEALLADDGVAA